MPLSLEHGNARDRPRRAGAVYQLQRRLLRQAKRKMQTLWAWLAVSEAIVGHRDLGTLFQELAGRLQLVGRFDFLALVLLDARSNTTRVHVLQTSGFWPEKWLGSFPLEETPNGDVLQTQQPLIVSEQSQLARWPRYPGPNRRALVAGRR